VKPANTFFCQCDILNPNGLPYPEKYFDYIHIRQVYSCFSEEDWMTIMNEIKRLLKPGGYIELRDIEPMLGNTGPVSYNFFVNFPFLMKKWHDVDILWGRRMFDFLNEVGEMVDVHQQITVLQFGSPGPIGNMVQNSLRLALQSFRPFFSRHNNLPGAKYDKVIEEILEETKKYHSYFNYYCCWGRNPLYDTAYHHQDVGDDCSRRYSFPHNNKPIDRHHSNASSNMSPPLLKMRENRSEEKKVDSEAATSPNILNIYPSNQHQQMLSLAEDSVTDIDQFAEGYED
jgi:SAM-dependent methyltransferase